MIKSVRIYVGPDAPAYERPTVDIPAGTTTVFVGPNASGKSLLLREFEQYLLRPPAPPAVKLFADVTWAKVPVDHLMRLLKGEGGAPIPIRRRASGPPGPSGYEIASPGFRDSFVQDVFYEPKAVDGFVDADPSFGDDYLRRLARVFCLQLNAAERLSVLGPDSGQHRDSPLGVLVRNRGRRQEVRRRAYAALGLYFCVEADPFRGVQARLSTEEVPVEIEESFSEESQRFFARTIPFEDWSDGQRAYLGILTALMGADYQIVTIDEPEMCLHPPLARQLGRDIAEVVAARLGSAIVASHSPDFLMGCVQSGRTVSVARLSYTRGVSDPRVLSPAELSPLMREPLLRSTGLLQCVFHKGVVVCEGDPDRAFYEEVNLRLFNSARSAVDDGVFLHSNGWQPMHRIVAPLRQLGIPTAAIVDLDALGPGGDLVPLLKAAQVPSATIDGLLKTRDVLRQGLTEDDLKRGLSSMSAQDAARELVDQLAGYGVFLVDVGELERWLAHLGVRAKGGRWLVEIFDRLGSDPDAANYVKPTIGDVWQFLERIAAWISDPHRKGMPASAPSNTTTR